MTDDIKRRLKDAMVGHPHAKIPWPHRVLHDAVDRIEELETERDELAKALEAVRERCFFDDDNGQIGISEDVVIESALFDQICAAIAKAKGQRHDY